MFSHTLQEKPQIYLSTQPGRTPLHTMLVSHIKLEHINCIVAPTEKEGGIYIGDTIASLQLEHLAKHTIQAILCCNSESANLNSLDRPSHKLPWSIDLLMLDSIQDRPDFPISRFFDSSYDFIEACRRKGRNILVQCHGGVSRSATIAIAYLIRKNKWSAESALNFVRSKRERVKPNAGFWQQLKDFAEGMRLGRCEEKPIFDFCRTLHVQSREEQTTPMYQRMGPTFNHNRQSNINIEANKENNCFSIVNSHHYTSTPKLQNHHFSSQDHHSRAPHTSSFHQHSKPFTSHHKQSGSNPRPLGLNLTKKKPMGGCSESR